MIAIEILSEMVRLYDLGIRPQVVRGMWREEKEWEYAIEQARQRVREWNQFAGRQVDENEKDNQ